jgi:hypothetical protein
MPAARKVAGGIGVGGSVLDPFYTTQRLSDLNNVDDTVKYLILLGKLITDSSIDLATPNIYGIQKCC